MKNGLDYFPVDIDFFDDEKIQYVSAKFGYKGEYITLRLLGKIYRNGYYLPWNGDNALLLAKNIGEGITADIIKDVVDELLIRNFLSKDIFEKHGVLTSNGIQNRYFEVAKRRKKMVVVTEYLIPHTRCLQHDNILIQNVDISQKNVDIIETSKGKEVKESKGSNRAKALVVSGETTQEKNQRLKKSYDQLVDELKGKEKIDVWKKIREFIITNQPEFIEPYADVWNLFASNYKLAQVQQLSASRKKKFNTRIQEPAFDFLKILEKIKESGHLKGDNNRGWKVTFDWIIENDMDYLKIIEGQYQN